MNEKSLKSINIEDIFCKDGLYIEYKYDRSDAEEINKIYDIETDQMKIDFHCLKCNQERIFKSDDEGRQITFGSKWSFSKRFVCLYCEEEYIEFYFRIEDDYLMKVGQFPSLADLTREDTKKYKNILNRDDYSDLNRAIGLHSHGVGAGSLIYLRRVFENLVKKAYDESVEEDKWNKGLNFYRIPMEDKIKNLEGYLPKFVLENHYIYGILSKGIHELSEQECRDYFDILRESIFIILDEEIKRVEEKKRIDTASKSLSKIKSMLGEKK